MNSDSDTFLRKEERNPEVIALLETYLQVAKEHKMSHVAISLVNYRGEGSPTDFACFDYAGDFALEKSQQEAIGLLHNKISIAISNWEFPKSDETLGADHVRYNIATGPLSFDFIIWLVDAEMTRVREGAPAPLRVAFWLGKQERLTPKRELWLNNVFRPMLSFIGAVEDDTAINGRHKELYVPRDIVAAYNAGEKLPILKPPRIIEPTQPPVTITLRESDNWPYRNSNMEAWCRFAKELMERGEHVIFVRDTAKAYEPLPGFMTYPTASIDLGERFSLYECAKANLFVSNGPAGLTFFGQRPCLIFTPIENDNCQFIANTPWFWRNRNGIEMGEQWPWYKANQRLIWKIDSYENIVAAWNEHFEPKVEPDAMRLVPEPVRPPAALAGGSGSFAQGANGRDDHAIRPADLR